MKKFFFALCALGIVALIASCSSSSNPDVQGGDQARRGRFGSGGFGRGGRFGSGSRFGSGGHFGSGSRFGSGAGMIRRLDIPEEAKVVLDEIRKARNDRNYEKAQELEKTLNEKWPDAFPKRERRGGPDREDGQWARGPEGSSGRLNTKPQEEGQGFGPPPEGGDMPPPPGM